MKHESGQETKFVIEDSNETFEYWLGKPYIPDTLREQLSKANFLILPRERYLDKNLPLFPNSTEEVLSFFNQHHDKSILPDICIGDNDYNELILHDNYLILGAFLVTSIVAPVAVNLLSEFIKNKLLNNYNRTNIKVEITIVKKDGSAKKFLYEGPANEFDAKVIPVLKSFSEIE